MAPLSVHKTGAGIYTFAPSFSAITETLVLRAELAATPPAKTILLCPVARLAFIRFSVRMDTNAFWKEAQTSGTQISFGLFM